MRGWVAAIAATAALAVAAPAAGAVPAKYWGVVPQVAPTQDQFQRLKAGGVDSMRIPLSWSSIQPERGGPLNWAATDALVGRAANVGMEALPFLTGAPRWAVRSHPRWHSPVNLPVRTGLQRSAWKNFVRQAVLRYGPNGSFWLENPQLPPRPIRVWQIWNEANFMYFVARPNPAEYGKLVNLSYAAIRSADKGAKLILCGLFSRPAEARLRRKPKLAYYAADFLSKLYRTRGIKKKFQGIALHPYTGTFRRLTPYVEEIRRVLKQNRDAGKGLWITELGWSSQPKRRKEDGFAKGRGGQAKQLKGAFRLLKSKQRKWRVQRVYWFSVDDHVGSCNFCDGSGLFDPDFTPKPSWYAYVRFAGGSAG